MRKILATCAALVAVGMLLVGCTSVDWEREAAEAQARREIEREYPDAVHRGTDPRTGQRRLSLDEERMLYVLWERTKR